MMAHSLIAPDNTYGSNRRSNLAKVQICFMWYSLRMRIKWKVLASR